MIYFQILLAVFVIFSSSAKSSDIKIIEIHKNKSLDQLVLDTQIKNEDSGKVTDEEINLENVNFSDAEEGVDSSDNIESEEISTTEPNNNEITFIKSQSIFDLDENIINFYLESIINVQSKTLQKELIRILSNSDIKNQNNIEEKAYFVIKKLYDIGEIGKAYNLIKNINKEIVLNEQSTNYFYFIELNYLFSTFKLAEVCELKTTLLELGIKLPKFLLEKTDIFCLTLANKFAEAELLNSLLLETEKETDKNFQKLFKYMILNENNEQKNNSLKDTNFKELIFLYSAMLRINELPLNAELIEIDSLNLLFPVILSEATKMDIRVKAANRAFYDEVLSIESLSALYQSVDFNAKQFSNPEQTIISLENNIELIMAFYFQLANIQIFPDQRLNVIVSYWQFAKKVGLEKISYALTKNIIETFEPTSSNVKFGIEIALAHIENKNYNEALNWINLYKNPDDVYDKTEYAKFLISLNDSEELDTIKKYLFDNLTNFNTVKNQRIHETLDVLIEFMNIEKVSKLELSYDIIDDNRLMPSYFLIKDIENNIFTENDLSLFMLSLISIKNKNWIELHPEHLKIILNVFNSYKGGSLIKPLILEILNEIDIFNE